MAKDYYDILGVSKTASSDEIKRAFRKKAHQYHPDKGTGDEEKFKEVNEAYQVLGNKEKREQYDQFGSTYDDMRRNGGGFGGARGPFGAGAGNGGGFNGQGFDFGNINDLGDIFSEFFGGAQGASRPRGPKPGRDMELEMAVDFEEAVFGVEKTITIDIQDTCETCTGTGAKPGSAIDTCATCRGSGQVQQIRNAFLGQIRTAAICPECNGEGKIPKERCVACKGVGVSFKRKNLTVEIPGGIQDGQTIRLSGRGEAGPRGGGKGDVYIHVRVRPSKEFQREGNDIHSEIEISMAQAALGDDVRVKTVDGEGTLTIPAGTQSGSALKIRGKGARVLSGAGRGDHIVTVRVKTPKKLSRQQKKLFEELKSHDDPSHFKGWF